jgi:hypothetical protein
VSAVVMVDPSDIVHCEVCELTHRRGAVTCEDCGHALGATPNWVGIEREARSLRLESALGIAASGGLTLLTLWLAGGIFYVISLGPFAWGFMRGYRYRVLSKRLATRRAGISQSPDIP